MKLLISVFRRLRSVVVLCGTVALLLYYTFENEVSTLNSLAENESLPQIYKQAAAAAPPLPLAPPALLDSANDAEPHPPAFEELHLPPDPDDALRDPAVLGEKNKYFPLLHKSDEVTSLYPEFDALDTKAEFFKPRDPVRYESPFKNTLSPKPKYPFPRIQAEKFPHSSEDAVKDTLEAVKDVFMTSWRAYYRLALGSDELKPISKYPSSRGVSRANTMLESLDMLYILNQTEEVAKVVSFIQEIDFTHSKEPLVDLPQSVERSLGSLISAYELSGHQEPVFLTKATELANFLLRAFDTPNRIPVLKFPWQSKLNNRFPFQDSSLGQLGSVSLEFLRLSQLTKDEKYTRAAEHIYKTAFDSIGLFDIDYLLPTVIDASGCVLLPKEQVHSGKHAQGYEVMKTIHDKKYVHCLQTNKFLPIASQKSLFSADFRSLPFYSNMLKFYQLLGGSDSTPDFAFSKHLVNSFDRIRKLMIFTPALPNPAKERFSFVNSFSTESHYDARTSERVVNIVPDYTMHQSSCALGSVFALMGKIFDDGDYINIAADITRGCAHLSQLLGVMPESVHVRSCPEGPCEFDPSIPWDRARKTPKAESALGVSVDDSIIDQDASERSTKVYIFSGEETSDPVHTTEKWVTDSVLPEYIDGADPSYNLSSEVIESIFYLYRVTGDDLWRQKGLDLWKSTLRTVKGSSAKGVGQISSLSNIFTYEPLDALPAEWFGKHLKFYYLLFQDESMFNLDDYVFTSGGHIISKSAMPKPSSANSHANMRALLEQFTYKKEKTGI